MHGLDCGLVLRDVLKRQALLNAGRAHRPNAGKDLPAAYVCVLDNHPDQAEPRPPDAQTDASRAHPDVELLIYRPDDLPGERG